MCLQKAGFLPILPTLDLLHFMDRQVVLSTFSADLAADLPALPALPH
jgi:hypothetical protein